MSSPASGQNRWATSEPLRYGKRKTPHVDRRKRRRSSSESVLRLTRIWRSPSLYFIAVPVALVNAVDARRILDRSNSENRAEPPGYIGKPDPAYDLIIPVCTPQRGPHCPDLPAGEPVCPSSPVWCP